MNETARVLLTPAEYLKARESKRAMPKEKTWAGAYKKTAKSLGRVVDGDREVQEMLKAPMPNVPVIGAYLTVVGTLLAPLAAGFEYFFVIGCAACLHGGKKFGMEPEPEFYFAGVVAILALCALDASKPSDEPPKKKKYTKRFAKRR